MTSIAEHALGAVRRTLPAVLDQVIDLPGWTQEVVDRVTQDYRADVAEIAVLPGVEFVLP